MDTKRFTLSTALTLIAAYLGLFVGLIDANAINLALPAIRDDLGGGISGAQWTIDAYNITFAAVLLKQLGDGPLAPRIGAVVRCHPVYRASCGATSPVALASWDERSLRVAPSSQSRRRRITPSRNAHGHISS